MKDSEGTRYPDSEIYRAYRVCKRLVWLGWHVADGVLEDPWQDTSLIHLAKQLFANVVDVAQEASCFEESVDLSKRLLRTGKVVFNATFTSSIGVATADIIVPLNEDFKELIVVCPTHGVHPLFIEKIAYTAAVLLKNGIELRRISLLKANLDYKNTGVFDPARYFVRQVITGRVAPRVQEVEDNISEIFKIIRSPHPPEQVYDKHCYNPLVCQFFENCWRILPEYNILMLYRGGKKIRKLMESGIFDIRQIDSGVELSEKQQIQVIASKTGEPFVNKRAIKQFIKKLKYPLHFLDFETIATALPVFKNTKPFEMIPYEFSLNILDSPSASVRTINYIADTNEDPRPEILKILSSAIKPEGSVVAYNAGFETACLRECARVYPEYSEWFEGIRTRMVDLLKPFRSLDYYHPDQKGSASLKVVLPCLTGTGYDKLAIKNGEQAAEWFLKMLQCNSAEEKAVIRRHLEDYCYTDSIGMLRIVEALKKLVE